jgi:hypothetical protein
MKFVIKFTVPLKRDSDGSESPLLPLKTAGPNFKKSILGAPLDAVAWLRAPEELRNSFRTLSNYFIPSLTEM